MKGKTKSGFKYEVSDKATRDMELLDAIAKLLNGDWTASETAIIHLIGASGKTALYDHCRDEDGIADRDLVYQEITEIMVAMSNNSETKNS